MKTRFLLKSAAATCVAALAAAPAYAQASRTWVSGVGDDANPCSRTAPCKTFAGAISKTAAAGEINCLDPGGFGALTITKSITIDCSDVFGSALNSGVNGFLINDSLSGSPNTIRVVIRGVHINGAGSTPGVNGIRFISGASLVVENVTIQNQSTSGISIQPGGLARIYITNTTITNVGTTGAGRGILIQPTGAGGNARVHIANSRIYDVPFEGIRVDASGNTNPNPIVVNIESSEIAGSASGLIAASSPGLSFVRVPVSNSAIFNNNTGITSFGTPSTVLVGLSTITGNNAAISLVSGGIIQSYGNNLTQGNTTAPTFTPPVLTPN